LPLHLSQFAVDHSENRKKKPQRTPDFAASLQRGKVRETLLDEELTESRVSTKSSFMQGKQARNFFRTAHYSLIVYRGIFSVCT